MPDARLAILFLCTGNSARSILGEAIAGQCFGDALVAASAGSRPKREPHPLALETLRRHGLSTAGLHSKPVEAVADRAFDLVLTLCDAAAREACPALAGGPQVVHWPLPDPPAADDPAAAFERVFATLRAALGRLAADGDPEFVRRAERARPGPDSAVAS
ncbi:MAG: arsenate reductase ArsC [Planctomycetota bacterium]